MPATEPAPERASPPAAAPACGPARAPFSLPRRLAFAVAVAAALSAGGTVAAGVADLEPSLVLHLIPVTVNPNMQVWELRAEPRGGETIAAVHLEIAEGRVEVMGRRLYFNLQPDNAARFTLRVERTEPVDPLIRIRQEGRVSRSYELRLPVDRR